MPYWASLPDDLDPAHRQLITRLRALKDEHRLTYKDMGRLTHYSKASWERWLNGKRMVTRPALASLLAATGNDDELLRLHDIAAAPESAPDVAPPTGAAPDLPAVESSAAASSPRDAAGRDAAPSRVLAQLPRDVPDFTGREASVAGLCRLLEEGSADGPARPVVVSALTGTGGVGKTALALHVGHRVRGDYPDGQLYVNLRGTGDSPRDPAGVLVDFLRDLGEPDRSLPQDAAACAAGFRSVTAGRRLLIVLDDALDAAQVRPLLPGSGACGVLVTSRHRLPGLAGAVPLHLDVLPPSEARALFTSVVGAARVRAEPGAVEEVLGFCGGLPLAVRIAASRLASRPNWTVAALAARLADEHRRLDELQVEDTAVRASFRLSYASLPDADAPGGFTPARAFRLLGLVPGPDFGARTAAVLFDQPPRRTEDLLGVLVDANLLEEPSPGRYRFHDLLRVYAAELAAAAEGPEPSAALDRLLDWYVHTAAAASRRARPYVTKRTTYLDRPEVPGHPALAFDSYDQAMEWYEQERAGLVAAVSLAGRTGRHEVACQLPYALYGLLYLRNHTADWIATHQVAVTAAQGLGHGLIEAATWNNLSNAYHTLKRFDDALECYERALTIYQDGGDRLGEANTLANLGMLNGELGRYDEALDYNRRCRESYVELGDLQGQASAMINLAEALRLSGRLQEAARTAAASLVFVREHGFRGDEVYILVTSGEIHGALGRDEEALDDFRQAAERAHAVGERRLEAIASDQAARLLAAFGRKAEAAEAWRQALAIMRETGDPAAADVATRLRAVGG
ncbi:Helix-turn-helix domain-containing protein [Actinacidiphila yanglinensis]|uniref:Helix-turn-helix domain-containing protein n=1 Tax=Actinacidiphila yanglinensis TaxID=310779 RepID=A0A1H6BAE2_9ACTN|nr:helix-turn-helix domain-containing protein [Actinacidiphila yanglinensis]SEG57335.1 Helix-turn-helix domain-containing protein [Actinacidiphila yanglinensis]